MKKFGLIFFYAALGGIIYELFLYFYSSRPLDWLSAIIRVFSIALIVSIVLALLRDFFNRNTKSEKEA